MTILLIITVICDWNRSKDKSKHNFTL